MRQLNFLLLFALCLALALFSIENTQTVAINVISGVQLEAPLSIELLLAVGTGAMLAWMFSLWDRLQRQIESWKAQRELNLQSKKIAELEKTISELQTSEEILSETSENVEVEISNLSELLLSEAAPTIAVENATETEAIATKDGD